MIRLSRKHPPKLIEDTIRGIYVQIPDGQPLGLLFNSQGRLRYYQSVPAQFILNAVQGAVHYMVYPMGIATLGVEPHVGVCAVLKMLKAKFMANLEVKDSTRFYETGNLDALRSDRNLANLFAGMVNDPEMLGVILDAAGIPKGANLTVLDSLSAKPPNEKPAKQTIQ